ncbi:MAG: hypothetical protein AB1631_21540 [Acidobacteriota bacterium]
MAQPVMEMAIELGIECSARKAPPISQKQVRTDICSGSLKPDEQFQHSTPEQDNSLDEGKK